MVDSVYIQQLVSSRGCLLYCGSSYFGVASVEIDISFRKKLGKYEVIARTNLKSTIYCSPLDKWYMPSTECYDTALYEVESPVTTWVLALGSYL